MKISKEDIKKYADAINIEVSEAEVNSIEASIMDITSRLDQLLAEDTGDYKRKMLGTDIENQLDSTHINEVAEDDHMKNLNNFDGEYIGVEKVIIDE